MTNSLHATVSTALGHLRQEDPALLKRTRATVAGKPEAPIVSFHSGDTAYGITLSPVANDRVALECRQGTEATGAPEAPWTITSSETDGHHSVDYLRTVETSGTCPKGLARVIADALRFFFSQTPPSPSQAA